MKSFFLSLPLMMVMFCCIVTGTADASGLGFYLTNGSGTAVITNDYSDYEVDVDTHFSGFGVIIDSNVSMQRTYASRLTFGPETIKLKDSGGNSFELEGYTLHSDFGWGGNIADVVRLYGGFQFRAAFYVRFKADEYEEDASITGFGVGPIFGININPLPVVTFSLKAGYDFCMYTGDINGYDFDLQNDKHLFFNLGLIFRFSEYG